MVQSGVLQRKLRILCLGGWRTNAKVLDEQLNITGIREACKDIAEFVPLDPTHLAEGSPETRVARLDPAGPYYQWWYFDSAAGVPETAEDDQTKKTVIWHSTEDNTSPPRKMSATKLPVYTGVDATLARLSNILSTGVIAPTGNIGAKDNVCVSGSTEATDDGGNVEESPLSTAARVQADGAVHLDRDHTTTPPHFDGIFGFSQGGCCTALMAMLANEGDNRFAGKFRFTIIASGFRPQVPDLFTKFVEVRPIKSPSLHIMSDKDILWESSKQLLADFENAHSLIHERGHSLPPAVGKSKLDFVHFLEMQRSAKGV